jgi:hypothetical protein
LGLSNDLFASGTSLRGKSITRKPRITKADRQRMEQGKFCREELEKGYREALEQIASAMLDQHLLSDEEFSDANIAQNHSPKTCAFLGGLSRGRVDFTQISGDFKQLGCQP